ncbi:MAG: OmpA family protein [Micrococcales bacterium]|nr:OmpA family protein [Micrococcales bacterium]
MQSLDLSGEVTFPGPVPLRTYTRSYVEGVSASGQGSDQTVTLASDVLFDTDKFDLTPDAALVVAEARTAINGAATGGEVHVVGHTDDVASAEYNMELSVKRAQTVAEALDLPSGFTVVSEGKGKTLPAVPGTSEEARAANRRVEIRFTAERLVGFEGSAIPAAQVPVSSGNAPVEYQNDAYGDDPPMTVSVGQRCGTSRRVPRGHIRCLVGQGRRGGQRCCLRGSALVRRRSLHSKS